jgi:hypothetical protein
LRRQSNILSVGITAVLEVFKRRALIYLPLDGKLADHGALGVYAGPVATVFAAKSTIDEPHEDSPPQDPA